jgi:hypothetical protein
MLDKDERFLLDWLRKGDGQYGECRGKALDALVAKGFATIGGEETGLDNGFIAKGSDLDYRVVSITSAGIDVLASSPA